MLASMRADPSRARPRGRLGCLSALALLILMPIGLILVITPWGAHIGGRSTFLRSWDGFGEVHASNGGRYVLFTTFYDSVLDNMHGGRHGGSSLGHRDNLSGTAELCTESGAVHSFKLAGFVDGWRTTDGARTWIRLTGGAPVKLQAGWVLAWHGAWHGPVLELEDPDSSFTEAFTPRGEIRRVTSTADAGTARVALAYGTHDDFVAACGKIHGGAH
jgi:hypothetical protein